MKNEINVLSSFDGISCGMVALERAGIKVNTYYASEINEKAIEISQKNYPNIVRLGDVTGWREWDIPWTEIDLFIGGSPCQGFSKNGKCLNFNDPRSSLFFEYVNILNNIKEKNPNILFLLENVKMKSEWKNVITEYLGVEPIEINSKIVSAQNRERLYWTNIPNVKQPQNKNINLIDILEHTEKDDIYVLQNGIWFDASIPEAHRKLASKIDNEIRIKQVCKKGYIVAENGDGINLSFPTSKTRRGRVIKQKSPTLDTMCNVCVLYNDVIRKLTIKELERLQTLPDNYTNGASDRAAKSAIGNGWTVDVIAHILNNLKINNNKMF